jgi:tRNA A37 methylthiotransferase MiaB
MRRFGSAGDFLELLARIRQLAPQAGARSNVIVGFPGETDADVEELERFLVAARLDVIGVFGYSDEEGTEAASMPGKLDEQTISKRVTRLQDLADELVAQRAEDRIGEPIRVLVDSVAPSGDLIGTAAHQAPDVDGSTRVVGTARGLRRGDSVIAEVIASEGADLVARASAEDEP